MHIKTVSFHKTIKKNLGNYNMLEAGYGMEIDLEPGETIDNNKVWEEISREIDLQAGTNDPSWIRNTDTGKTYTKKL